MFGKLSKFISEFLFRPMSARPLACLRIVLGVTMIAETLQIWGSIDDLFGPYGFLETGLMNAVTGRSAPSFAFFLENHGFDYLQILHFLFWIRWAVLLTFTLGWWTRTSTAVLWLMQVFIMASGPLSNYGVDRYFILLIFILVWCPSGESLSVDRMLQKNPLSDKSDRASFGLRVLQMALLITYANSGISKAMGTEWWTGDAIWRVLHLPEFHHYSFLWFAQWPLIPKVLGWGTLFIETFYIFGAWIPRVRTYWVIAIVSLHIGIAVFMGLVSFGITMALINAVLFLSEDQYGGPLAARTERPQTRPTDNSTRT